MVAIIIHNLLTNYQLISFPLTFIGCFKMYLLLWVGVGEGDCACSLEKEVRPGIPGKKAQSACNQELRELSWFILIYSLINNNKKL